MGDERFWNHPLKNSKKSITEHELAILSGVTIGRADPHCWGTVGGGVKNPPKQRLTEKIIIKALKSPT